MSRGLGGNCFKVIGGLFLKFNGKKLCKVLSFSEGFRKMIIKPTEKSSHMITGRAVTKGPLPPTITRWISVPFPDVVPQRRSSNPMQATCLCDSSPQLPVMSTHFIFCKKAF